jgi:putative endonuclease
MKLVPGFTAKYNVNRLVWYEEFSQIKDAIACEKRIEGWTRRRKVALIQPSNPSWHDLSEVWSDSDEEQIRRDPSLRSG